LTIEQYYSYRRFVRELCSMHTASERRIIAFERSLQKAVARIRKEMGIEVCFQGFYPEQLKQLLDVRDAIHNPRKNGIATLRQCSLSGIPQPEPWLDVIRSQVGDFPLVVRSVRHQPVQDILHTEREFRQWLMDNSTIDLSGEYVVQEFIEGGYDFTALCTAKGGLIACAASIETHRTILECVKNQLPYAIQLFSVEQTRDILPGVESFTTQVIKASLSKSYVGAVFIKGFYKDHNDIFFLGCTLEPESDTLRTLFAMSPTLSWETNGITASPSVHHCVVNFPRAEGVLIHQTSIPKRPTSEMRVAWRCAEGQEMKNSVHIDDNVVQVYLSNSDHTLLIDEAQDIMQGTDITIDRNVLLERHSVCRRNLSRLNPRELIRSCTTRD
uniref:ATP-grasp domain-containing protein n=1 Tax=Angiostrongylus cantonensis TaxID=6313 RepID=A0A0K0D069_ANGCA